MSWNAYLYVIADGNKVLVKDWNYTHNCNHMANTAIESAYRLGGRSWWQILGEMGGYEGRNFLSMIIMGLERNAGMYQAMNPLNGWGDYTSFVEILKDMRNESEKYPTAGRWETSG